MLGGSGALAIQSQAATGLGGAVGEGVQGADILDAAVAAKPGATIPGTSWTWNADLGVYDDTATETLPDLHEQARRSASPIRRLVHVGPSQ
jgi:hypothetical protein